MKALVLFFVALAPLACSSPPDSSIYGIETPSYEAGGPQQAFPSADPGGEDASTCAVKGGASVSGVSLAAKDAIEVFDPTEARFEFRITDYASACSLGHATHAGSSVVSIAYDAAALSSGKYDLAKTDALHATYVTYDGSCNATQKVTAESGTVTFDRVDDCGGKGSFDLVFGGTHVTATFTASVCSLGGGAASCE